MKIREWVRISRRTDECNCIAYPFTHHMPNIAAGDTHNAMSKCSFHIFIGDDEQISEITNMTSGNEKCNKILSNNRKMTR